MSKWHNLSIEETLAQLGTNRHGLTDEEARKRLGKYGRNELHEKGRTPWPKVFLRQFASPLIYILLAAAAIELFYMGKPTDAGVIFVVVLLNSFIGFFQEQKAEKAMEALKRLVVPKAKVLRGGTLKEISAYNLVPGDIIFLEGGDKVPADARIMEAFNLAVDESILTGESVAVEKFVAPIEGDATVADMGNMVHMGCTVVSGRGVAIVVATGMSTEIGKITAQIQEVKPPLTPLQRNVHKLGRFIGLLVLGIVGFLSIIGWIKGYSFEEIFTLGIAAAVSAIPEGLPVMVTVVLALGMRRMALRNALVRKLPAVETMGAVTVICTDKTGTLTESEMTVREIFVENRTIEVTGGGFQIEGKFLENGKELDWRKDASLLFSLQIGVLCNDSALKAENGRYQLLGDPTEGALLIAALKAGIKPEELRKEFPRMAELPFESEKRYMATLHPGQDGQARAYVKGAVDKILAMSNKIYEEGAVRELSPQKKAEIEKKNEEMAARALRVLALAFRECPCCPENLCLKNLDGNLIFVALVGMIDPPRKEAKEAVAACKRAGIKVVMITGDQKLTAQAIAAELGFPPGEAVTGLELEKMSPEEFQERVEKISVFARVEPLHKLKIVNALKARGHIVAMTGDGVNDGPALRSADIGVAMGIKGTDVAREAADMVLTDDNFASIVAAVEEGRVIFSNIRRSVFYLMSTNIGELFTWTLALLSGIPLPVVAVQILWINLVTDGVCTIPLGLEPKHSNVLEELPRRAGAGIVYPGMLWRIIFIALFMALGTFLVFKWELTNVGLEEARTIAFGLLVAFQWFNALNARSDQQSLFKLGLFTNRWLMAGIGLAVILQLGVIYIPFMQKLFYTVPLGWDGWLVVILVSASILGAEEIRKIIAPRIFNKGKLGAEAGR